MGTQEIILLLIIGLISGIVSGSLGVGGGIIMIPALIYVFGLSQHEAQGTSLAILLPPTGILAAMTYHKQGFINWKYAAVICVIFVFGAWLGAYLSTNLPAKTLKKIFACFLIIAGAKILWGK